MENKKEQTLDSEYLLPLMRKANTDKDAAFELGKLYLNGTKLPQDTQRALFYFQQATDLGHWGSQAISGYLYKVGAFDLTPNLLKAAELFEIASMTVPDDEVLWWEAVNLLLYGGDGGTPLNEDRGVRLLKILCQMQIPYAVFLLGEAHEKGLWGITEDRDEATRLYHESAELGCNAAIWLLKNELPI